jgi:metallophosphoesterase superfamily enzyme
MKAGDIVTADTKDAVHIHGHRFELVREEIPPHTHPSQLQRDDQGAVVGPKAWLTRDLENGENRYFGSDDFGKLLKPAK